MEKERRGTPDYQSEEVNKNVVHKEEFCQPPGSLNGSATNSSSSRYSSPPVLGLPNSPEPVHHFHDNPPSITPAFPPFPGASLPVAATLGYIIQQERVLRSHYPSVSDLNYDRFLSLNNSSLMRGFPAQATSDGIGSNTVQDNKFIQDMLYHCPTSSKLHQLLLTVAIQI